MDEHRYTHVLHAPYIQVRVTEHGYDLPGSVLREIHHQLNLMVEHYPSKDPLLNRGADTCGQLAAGFEDSTITVGHSPEERADLVEYYNAEIWPNVQGGQPVATWNSGISTGCTTELFVMPDGSFEWTTP